MFPRLLLSLLALAVGLGLPSCSSHKLTREYPAGWRAEERSKAPRWVVAYPSSHASALASLKRKRASQGYEVVSISAATPAKVATSVAGLNLGERVDDCLLLVGDTKLLPSARGRHHRMKNKGADSRYAMEPHRTTPLFAVGRLPSSTAAETRTLVRKILAFEQSRQRSKSKAAILLVGDPVGDPERVWPADFLVTSLSNSLMNRAHDSWTFTGAADVPGHRFGYPSPEFASAFRKELNRSYAVGAYFGHSNSTFLCRTSGGTGTLAGLIQHSFGKDSWDSLKPSNSRGLFLSCGCYCLKDDAAVGYRSVKAPGGPVAFIGATRESYGAIGYLAAKGAVEAMTEHPPRTAGNWFLSVQNAIARAPISGPLFFAFDRVDGTNGKRSLREQRTEHLEMWMLVGDPATRLF